jgi:hypothetical protein
MNRRVVRRVMNQMVPGRMRRGCDMLRASQDLGLWWLREISNS